MARAVTIIALWAAVAWTAEAPSGFDNQSNGFHTTASPTEHDDDRAVFDEVDTPDKGLGPVYNAQSCRECHQSPISGGVSQVMVKRAVVSTQAGPSLTDPDVTVDDGHVIPKRSLINDRAICAEEQERVPEAANVRTNRMSLSVLGDGFLEAVPDDQIIALSAAQCADPSEGVCGAYLFVPVLEADGVNRVGRFGWKDQHASLLSFAADAYLNEVGLTTDLFPADVIQNGCDKVPDPEDPMVNGVRDIDRFARFMRATKAPPPRVTIDFANPPRGLQLFRSTGCGKCHSETLTTAPPGTSLNGGSFVVDAALGGKTLHPFSDLLLHDVGTGDGVPISVEEHYGQSRSLRGRSRGNGFDNLVNTRGGKTAPPGQAFSLQKVLAAANKLRTPPLWGVRTHPRYLHDGMSFTIRDATLRHKNEGEKSRKRFEQLAPADQKTLIDFVTSL
jgi:CxxC motif-containing protein (DUF1111 family)